MTKNKRLKSSASKLSHLRYQLALGSLLICFAVYTCYTVYKTMTTEGERWRDISKHLRPPREATIAPARGNIYDAHGHLLAISPLYYRIYVDFQAPSIQLLEEKGLLKERLDSLASVAAHCFRSTGVTKEQIKQRLLKGLKNNSRTTDILGKRISFLDYDRFIEQPIMYTADHKGHRYRSSIYRSISVNSESIRQWPYNRLAYGVLGNVDGYEQKGTFGIERAYDSVLFGVPGKELYRYIGGRNTKTVIQDPQTGSDIYTTLDIDIQKATEEALRKKLLEIEADHGSAVVLEAATGRIVALANLQRKANGSYGESGFIYAFSDMAESGSTFKAATVMAFLDDGIIKDGNSLVNLGHGSIYVGGNKTVKEPSIHLHGTVTWAEALARSSNVAMIQTAVHHYGDKPQRFVDKLHSFGLRDNLHLEIPGAQTGTFHNEGDRGWSSMSLPNIAYGYENQMPPIQIVNFYNAIANGGDFLRPYLIDSIVDYTGMTTYRGSKKILRKQICKPETITKLQALLRGVVALPYGTGKRANSPHVALCGKSGTAFLAKNGRYGKRKSVTFVAFFPYEHPQYTCIVNLFNTPPGYDIGGGSVSAPVVREIAEYITLSKTKIALDTVAPLEKRYIFPSTAPLMAYEGKKLSHVFSLPLHIPETVDQYQFISIEDTGNNLTYKQLPSYNRATVPNVIGLSAADATYLLMKHGYKVSLSGHGKVIQQSENPGTATPSGSKIALVLSPN